MMGETKTFVPVGSVRLIIAATAELAGLIALHLDKDFELIAEMTGQPSERLTTT